MFMSFLSLHHRETGKILRIFVFINASTYTIIICFFFCFFFFPSKNITGGLGYIDIRIPGGNHFIIKPVDFLFQAYDMSSILYSFLFAFMVCLKIWGCFTFFRA
jgi:hypothetical protein